MIDGDGAVGTRELGSNAFNSTTIPTNNNQLTNGAGFTTLALGTTGTTALAGNTTVGTVVAANPGAGVFDTLSRITIGGTSFNIPAGTGNGTVDTSGSPVDNDYAKFTDANTIEGRSTSEVKTDLSLNNVENKSSSTIRGEIVSGNIPNNESDTTGNAATSTKIASITNANIVQLAATQELTNKDLTGASNTFPTFNQSTTGNAATATLADSATVLATSRNINGVPFNGSANITITAAGSTLADTVPVSKGGTGATGASTARANLSAAKSGANVDITSIINSSLTTIGSSNSESEENYINFGAGKIALTQGANTVIHAGTDFYPGNNSMNLGKSTNMWVDAYSKQFISDASTTSTPAFVVDKDETNTGFYYKGTNQLAVTVGGNEIGYFNASGLQVTKTSATSQFSGHLQAHCLGIGTSPSTVSGEIRATGDIVANYSSDKRLKTNIKPISSALDKLLQISGVTFDWIEKEEIHSHKGHDVGVIAQEVEAVLPEVVVTRDNGYKAVNYEKIVPLLIESIKELKAEIDELKKSK